MQGLRVHMPGLEIDFLPVGTGSKSGDAIALRNGVPGDYRTIIIDVRVRLERGQVGAKRRHLAR